MPFTDLNGKVALITGSSSGIGYEVAKELKHAGAAVILTGTNTAKLEEASATLDATFFVADLSTTDGAKNLAEQVLEHSPNGVDIIVNNAGLSDDSLLIRHKDEDFAKIMQVNFTSAVSLTKLLLPKMMKKRQGRIVNITSVVAHMGNSGQTAYGASKAAMTGFTKSLAKEVARRGITVNALAPGFIETAMTAALPEGVKESYKQNIPLGSFGSVADVAHAVRFLTAEESSYITGTVLHVNGGLYI